LTPARITSGSTPRLFPEPAGQLSLSARILCAADHLDALSADRPYRGKLSPEQVIAIMRGERGTGLRPEAVDAAERAPELD
jgi:HD-GYP domain-containing protein (c-di-GMP phosphodiesterase class II)